MNDSNSSQPEQHSTTSPDWEETILLLSNLHRRMELSLLAIRQDKEIPELARDAAVHNIRLEMWAVAKVIKAVEMAMMSGTTGLAFDRKMN